MKIPHFLAYINTPERLHSTLSRYLEGQIEVGGSGDYSGADLRTAWYNRNLRIFSNIQRIPLKNDERVLVIIGQGQAPILQHLFENAPEYRLTPVNKYIKVHKN
jgi:hypothetical protein